MRILRSIFSLSLLCLSLLFLSCASAPEPEERPGRASASIELMEGEVLVYPVRWYGDRQAACSITFDDGTLDHYLIGAPELERHGIRGTFFVITGLAGDQIWHDGDTPRQLMNWDQIRELFRRGHEIASHTVHHLDLMRESDRADDELRNSLVDLRRELPGSEHFSLGWPYWRSTPENRRLAARYYYAARSGGIAARSGDADFGGVNGGTPRDYYAIGARGILASDREVELMLLLDEVYCNRGWLIPNLHGLGRGELKGPAVGWEALSRDEYRKMLDILAARDFWFAPFGEVARYARQREALELKLRVRGPSIRIHYKTSLEPEVYSLPLTIAIEAEGGMVLKGASGGGRGMPFQAVAVDQLEIRRTRYLIDIPPGDGRVDLEFVPARSGRLSLRAFLGPGES